MRISALPVLLSTGCALSLSACTFTMSLTTHSFGRADLERTVEHVLQQEGELEIVAVECPNSLQIKAHALTRCMLQKGDGSIIGATVVVTEAAGKRGRIDVAVDAEQPD
ncbi:DUF4333 domain-containing protein [Nocardia jinanensis]|uniref:DUF4333 domain-containing protein n=1 Tax=Nocardia jinanensis TaxID=382504 RepID=A0A917VNI0_9NOCA|nr:DUF4333 domain-containing protein [Nocardia jinanensis]GGK98725.1 hypothetical protein GCM10011588_11600 [Nocardia jinanensis]